MPMPWQTTTTPLVAAAENEEEGFGPMWTIYFCIILTGTCFQVITSYALIVQFFRLIARSFKRKQPRVVRSHVVAIVPCYLPNEEVLIKSTIEHILTKTEFVEQMDVHVVYNTPHDMPQIEAELQDMTKQQWPRGRRLFVQRVHLSTSKAANLNHLIPQLQSEYVVIYDADHHPDPTSLAQSVDHLEENCLDCVQGSTYIRQGCFLLRWLVHAEFFCTYFVAFPVLTEITGMGFFAGSNAVWRTQSLQRQEFDHMMLTEDIELTIRCMLEEDLKFGFLPESRSGELAPAGLNALWKQRLRWAMGWDQVTLHYTPFLSQVPFRKRMGMYYIWCARWLCQFCAVVIVLFNITYAIAALRIDHAREMQPTIICDLQTASACLFAIMVVFAYVQWLCQEPTLSLFFGLMLYLWSLPVSTVFNTVILVASLAKITVGGTTTWVVTARSHADSSSQSAITALPAASLRAAWWVLGMAFILLGGLFGMIVGRIYGVRTIVHHRMLKLWGFIVYGTTTTTTTVVDGKIVALGAVIGALAGLFLWVVVLWILRNMKHVEFNCCMRPSRASRMHSLEDSGSQFGVVQPLSTNDFERAELELQGMLPRAPSSTGITDKRAISDSDQSDKSTDCLLPQKQNQVQSVIPVEPAYSDEDSQ